MDNQKSKGDPNGPVEELSDWGRQVGLNFFNHVEQQVSLAATTAALIVAADALLLQTYLTVTKEFDIFHRFAFDIVGYAHGICGVFMLSGLICALLAITPNLSFRGPVSGMGQILFYGWVGEYGKTQRFVDEFRKADAGNGAAMDEHVLTQVSDKCSWLIQVFWLVRVAVVLTILGTVLLAGTTIVAWFSQIAPPEIAL